MQIPVHIAYLIVVLQRIMFIIKFVQVSLVYLLEFHAEEVLLENVELILEAFDYLQLPFALKEGNLFPLLILVVVIQLFLYVFFYL